MLPLNAGSHPKLWISTLWNLVKIGFQKLSDLNDFKFILFPKPSHGDFGQFFPTGTYTGIGTTCVESETCYEKHHEKKISEC